MGKTVLFLPIVFVSCLLCLGADGFQCLNGTDFKAEEENELKTSLKKYEGAALLLVGFGFFSVGVALIYTCIRQQVFKDLHNMDTAFDAGGKVSTSLTAVGVASQLLWPGDLMQSVTLCVKLGIAGAFWYCGTAIINMSLFPMLSYKFKTRAPGAKTYLQIIKARFNTPTHVVFIFFAILVNLVIMATVFVGGIAVFQATISDASPEYCVTILAALCGSYALIGGFGATIYASYFTSAVTYAILSGFVIKVLYMDDKPFGTLEEIYERVNCQSDVDGNQDGSRFTFMSEEALIYAAQILFLVSSITYCDQASWQSRIAAKPVQGALGFLLGSLLWFTVPATLGLVAGVTYVAETSMNSSFALSLDQINQGVVTSHMTEEALGTGGAIMMLTMLTMVSLSTGSAEIMAIASIIVYDIYQVYFRPFRRYLPLSYCVCCGLKKTGQDNPVSLNDVVDTPDPDSPTCSCPHVSNCSHCKLDMHNLHYADSAPGRIVHYTCPHHRDLRLYQDSVSTFKGWCILWVTVALIPFGVFLHAIELDLNWTMMAGVVFTVPSFPSVILAIVWSKTTSTGMIIGSISGLIVGCTADVAVAIVKYDWDGGFITATSEPYAVLAGSGGGFFISLILTFLISLVTHRIKTPEDTDALWQKLRNIDNPLYPWSQRYAEDFPHLGDGSKRPTQKELEQEFRYGTYVSVIGSILFFLVFIVAIPGALASLEVMSFEEFKIWAYVMTITLFVATVIIILVTPIEEIKAILTRSRRNKSPIRLDLNLKERKPDGDSRPYVTDSEMAENGIENEGYHPDA